MVPSSAAELRRFYTLSTTVNVSAVRIKGVTCCQKSKAVAFPIPDPLKHGVTFQYIES